METPKPSYLSDGYWSGLSTNERALYAIVRPLPISAYEIDVQLHMVDASLSRLERDIQKMGGVFELEPDFQRGHVWTEVQRSRYIEALLRGSAPKAILFNCPGWSSISTKQEGDIPPHTFQCIDGLQRLTAVRNFMAGQVTIFGGLVANDLVGTPFDPRRFTLKFTVHEFSARSELLQFYLDLNSGGSVHKPEELERVRMLMVSATAADTPAAEQTSVRIHRSNRP